MPLLLLVDAVATGLLVSSCQMRLCSGDKRPDAAAGPAELEGALVGPAEVLLAVITGT